MCVNFLLTFYMGIYVAPLGLPATVSDVCLMCMCVCLVVYIFALCIRKKLQNLLSHFFCKNTAWFGAWNQEIRSGGAGCEGEFSNICCF